MRTLLILAAIACLACGATTFISTVTGTSKITAKPPDCAFAVLSTQPQQPFEELGVLDWDNTGFVHGAASNVGEFKTVVASQVCAMGGDAVIAEVNGVGTYIKGIVIRWK